MSKDLEAFIDGRLDVLRTQNRASMSRSSRIFTLMLRASLYVALFIIILDLLRTLALDVILPVFDQDYSERSLLNLALTAYFLVAGVPLLMSCENTRVAHLPRNYRALTDFFLYAGALMFFASGLLLLMEWYLSFIVLGLVSVLTVRHAKLRAQRYA